MLAFPSSFTKVFGFKLAVENLLELARPECAVKGARMVRHMVYCEERHRGEWSFGQGRYCRARRTPACGNEMLVYLREDRIGVSTRQVE